MRLLLDTSTWIWLRYDPARLRPSLHAELAAAEDVWLSLVTPWEIAIAHAVGRLEHVVLPLDETVARFPILPIEARHVATVAGLPLHHRDPFDRMLIAQARADGLVIVTADRAISAYDVAVLPA